MKKDWTYKKLGEVAEIVGGSTPKTSEPANWEGSNMWVTPAELDGSKYFGKTQRTISDKAASKLQLLPIGTVLFSSRAPIGKVAITTAPMYCNQGFKNVICGDNLYNEYVYWCLTYNIPLLQSFGVGATFKELSKSAMSDFSIPIPPLSIQRSIVSELDLLHSVIEKKQEQLRALDNLAQSLFYQMFGDPITNPMGWEIKKLGEVCDVKGRIGFRGYTRNDFVDSSKDGAISLSPTNIINNQMDYSKCSYVTWDKYNESPEIMVKNGDILLVKTGSSYGKCAYVDFLPHEATINPQFVVIKEHKIISRYLTAYLQSEAAKIKYNEFVIGTAIPTFSQKSLNSMPILCPPLSLQQSFAAKVSAIEEQKRFISQSIKDVESLHAQRMDQYFG
ncbi:MAG: restriction endonuclease subunit S [Paludibacteraceae bacterium]|nr:restriction endonuclease subunit S [Paludibacteraceae bacterium]